MLYFCGRVKVLEKNKNYTLTAIYDNQTNCLDFYNEKGLKQLLLRNSQTGIQGVAAVRTQPSKKSGDVNVFLTSDDHGVYMAGGSVPKRSPYEGSNVYITEPVTLGTLRKGVEFYYKNLYIKIQTAYQDGVDKKVVAVGLNFGGITNNNKPIDYQEFYKQVLELMSCFIVNNSKLLWWKITTPLTDKIYTDCYLDLRLGKHRINTMLCLPVQGAHYVRFSVNDNTECYVMCPTRTVDVLDLRNNIERNITGLLMDSKVTEILNYFGCILISTKNDDYVNSLRHYFQTSAKVYYLGEFENMDDFFQRRNARAASYALTRTDKRVFFIANINEKI